MLSILLVDDEKSVVDTLEATIPWKSLGVDSIYKSINGEEALELLYMHPMDIVITDIQMPGMSGLELIKKVNETWSNTKCILLSGYAEFHFAQEAIKNQALEYLLKPISDDELIEALQRVIQQIKEEWEVVGSFQKAVYTLKENLPLLRGTLLNELIQGRKYSTDVLIEKLQMLELPFQHHDPIALVLVRLEEGYSGFGPQNIQLLYYSIFNIFEELAERYFHLWTCEDVHDYLVFLVTAKDPSGSRSSISVDTETLVTEVAAKLQANVNTYLKSKISITISGWGSFPTNLPGIYQSAISEMRKRVSNDCELFLKVSEPLEKMLISTLQTPYAPPTLIHLLEAGRWDTAEQKIHDIFHELKNKKLESMEHLMEVYFNIAGAFTYIAHKNGTLLDEILGSDEHSFLTEKPRVHTLHQLYEWALGTLNTVSSTFDIEMKTSRSSLIKEVQEYIDRNLSGDVSLRAVAEAVYLHPNYLSTLYKSETSEGLSEYTFRLRMERSIYHLKNSKMKIYEIAQKVGYQSPHYFIKVFRKHFGMTPQEYRDAHQSFT